MNGLRMRRTIAAGPPKVEGGNERQDRLPAYGGREIGRRKNNGQQVGPRDNCDQQHNRIETYADLEG
jgi:hypothetical protein